MGVFINKLCQLQDSMILAAGLWLYILHDKLQESNKTCIIKNLISYDLQVFKLGNQIWMQIIFKPISIKYANHG